MTSITDLPTNRLQLKKTAMETAMAERQKAASHPRFEKRKFPPHGQPFMNIYNEICKELESRKNG